MQKSVSIRRENITQLCVNPLDKIMLRAKNSITKLEWPLKCPECSPLECSPLDNYIFNALEVKIQK